MTPNQEVAAFLIGLAIVIAMLLALGEIIMNMPDLTD